MKSTLQEVFHKLFLHHNSHRKIHSNRLNKCLRSSSNSIQIISISTLESKNFHNKVSRINSQWIYPTITSISKCHILSNNSNSSHSNHNNNNLLPISSIKVLDSQVTLIHFKLPRISNNILTTLDIQIMVCLHTPIYLLFNNNSISLQSNYRPSTSHQNSNNHNYPNNNNPNQLKDSNSSSLHSNHKSKSLLTTTITSKQSIA